MSDHVPPDTAHTFHAMHMQDLPALGAFVDAACRHAGASADAAFAVRLSVEEAFVNILHHGYADQPGLVEVHVDANSERIAVTLHDRAPTFDPSTAPLPDIDAPLEQRQPGGLGWHLIRQMMDAISHVPGVDGGNSVTLTKRLC